MPAYGGKGSAYLLSENQQLVLWQGETIAAAAATSSSRAAQLNRTRGNFYPWGFAVEVAFGGAPGVFGIDVQVAETDQDANYITIGTISAVNASNVGRLDVTTIWAKFVRARVTTLTNAVSITAVLTR